jgi:ATP/maltotriose-dependent transcriptional regulator MalT
LLASIQAAFPDAGRAAQAALAAPQPVQKEASLDSLINDLDETGRQDAYESPETL